MLLSAVVGTHGPCLAGDRGTGAAGEAVLGALKGAAVPNADLGKEHGRGIIIGTAVAAGDVSGNSISGPTVTGTITNTNSVSNNTGITTVFQNTGNNSLFQQSTSISITVH